MILRDLVGVERALLEKIQGDSKEAARQGLAPKGITRLILYTLNFNGNCGRYRSLILGVVFVSFLSLWLNKVPTRRIWATCSLR